MSPILVLIVVLVYFSILLLISKLTSGQADNETFFIGKRESPWYVVAFGMIGASLSGVTFISVPGWVESSQFAYMQMVFGYLAGYLVIATLLLPLYYRLNLTSIYTYLDQRFGFWSYKSGSAFFLLSRTMGASARLFIVASVLQLTVFDAWNFPFFLTILITIGLIFLYTYRGGIGTIIWTDTLQTFFMLLAVGLATVILARELDLSFTGIIKEIGESDHSRIWFFENFIGDGKHFVKYFLGGAFITITMTGLDQDMMQKNLSCRNLKDAKKNVLWFSLALVPVNLVFLGLGALLLIYTSRMGIQLPASMDDLFPMIATQSGLSTLLAMVFMIGLIAAAFSSADSALTSLTTSVTVDMLGKEHATGREAKRIRYIVHAGLSLLLMSMILLFRSLNDRSVIDTLFTLAGFTYGPLLGLYSFGLMTKRKVIDRIVPAIAIVSPILTFCFQLIAKRYFGGYVFSFEHLIINGLLTFILLWVFSSRPPKVTITD
ncbi:MAG: sodium:solute symporter [Bacteroidetes bacterium]|nr:sodium:solute symporter [Bacteroidota bacterium]MBT4412353.1 sodium:solute symporter [Bacteroidota bacterium]MBT5424820.1 sodium:solute symporter [Bacteroidota bacterium]MBT7094847.1 sodium:solute symporter [Bacteroidota bacterium]